MLSTVSGTRNSKSEMGTAAASATLRSRTHCNVAPTAIVDACRRKNGSHTQCTVNQASPVSAARLHDGRTHAVDRAGEHIREALTVSPVQETRPADRRGVAHSLHQRRGPMGFGWVASGEASIFMMAAVYRHSDECHHTGGFAQHTSLQTPPSPPRR